ncbi:MAG: hypothetical protein J0J04_07780 [Microbacterium sp.]|uniref:hypothetical protein n=1 Tax=Microbacterium sp. TaxID=51671 RepID=UPI001AC14D93|nr:hypothetical protein [Microbacterium sp.]MBN9214698.1 hypothetical protein [Microbacterium sp.]
MTYPLSAIPTNMAGHPHRSAMRLDPYWDGVWQHGSVAQWASREHLERMERAGLAGKRPKHLAVDRDVALDRVDQQWQAKLDLLGVLSSWRTVTAEQYAAFSNRRLADSHVARALGDMFALDLIDTGSLWTPGAAGDAATRARMLRPSASHAFDQLIKPRMTYTEWVSVTAGEKFLTGGQYDRHNVLTAELILRVAEHLPVATALGERQSLMRDIAYRATGTDVPPGLVNSQKAGDAVIVRGDGIRIVVETTASWSKAAEQKAFLWAEAMERRPLSESGFIVVFVVSDRTNAGRGSRRSLDAEVRKGISRAVRFRPGTVHNRTAERMFVVDWRDWFPARHEVSDDFLMLSAQRPSGPAGAWEDVSLFDGTAVRAPQATSSFTAVAHYAAGLRLVPHQLRRGRQAQNLSDVTLRRFGFKEPPHLVIDPFSGAPRDELTRGYGATAATKIPERLVY